MLLLTSTHQIMSGLPLSTLKLVSIVYPYASSAFRAANVGFVVFPASLILLNILQHMSSGSLLIAT